MEGVFSSDPAPQWNRENLGDRISVGIVSRTNKFLFSLFTKRENYSQGALPVPRFPMCHQSQERTLSTRLPLLCPEDHSLRSSPHCPWNVQSWSSEEPPQHHPPCPARPADLLGEAELRCIPFLLLQEAEVGATHSQTWSQVSPLTSASGLRVRAV